MHPYENSKIVFVCLSVPREMKSPWLRQYQSYISNWYINEKAFTSTTPWEPKNLIFFKKNAYLSVSAVMFCKLQS